jgi:glycosidase
VKEFVGEGGSFDFIFDFRHTDLVMRPDSSWMQEKEWDLMKLKKVFNKIQQTYDQDSRVALFLENHDQLLENNQDLMAYLRVSKDKKVLVIANFKNKKVELEPGFKIKELILSNYSDSEKRLKAGQDRTKYEFRHFETLVLEVE